jgi:hypothetical protein
VILTKELSSKKRKELEKKMAKVFSREIDTLPEEVQTILLDDLVTAFNNRIEVLRPTPKRIQSVSCVALQEIQI